MRNRIFRMILGINNRPIAQKISLLFVILFGVICVVNTTSLFLIKRQETVSLVEQGAARNSLQISEYFTGILTSLVEETLLLNEYIADSAQQALNDGERTIALNKYVNGVNLRNNNFQYIHSILILGNDRRYAYRADNWALSNTAFSPAFLDRIRRETTDTRWTGILPASTYFDGSSVPVISFLTPFFPSGSRNSVAVLNLSVEGLSDYLTKQVGDSDVGILLDCGGGEYITSGGAVDALLAEEHFREALSRLTGSVGQLHHRNYVLAAHRTKSTGWLVITVTDMKKSTGSVYSYLMALTVTFLGLFLLLSIVAFTVVKMITRPLGKLSSIMEGVGNGGNLGTRFPARYEDEIGILARGYNDMMDRIVALTRRVVENEEEKRDAEIRLMQMQIKPHFLYNALETARFMAEMGDPQSIEMISSIAKFYKLTLSGVSEQTSVREELEQLECYLRIQAARYASVFTYSFQVDPAVYSFRIVKFSLQPLVENAIYHGLKQRIGQKGLLQVSAVLKDGDVVFEIYDNGVGMSLEELNQLRKRIVAEGTPPSQHIGVYNVNRRLQLSYGNDYGIAVDSVQGNYTRFTVRIPQSEKTGDNALMGVGLSCTD